MNAVVDIETILLLGGTSDIGVATARHLVREGASRVILAGRDLGTLRTQAEALKDAGAAEVEVVEFDAASTAGPRPHFTATMTTVSRNTITMFARSK